MHKLSIMLALVAVAGCTSSTTPTTIGDAPAADAGAGAATSPGPAGPAFGQADASAGATVLAAPVHGCTKIRTRTLGTLLASLGVPMNGGPPGSAADLYASGADALGTPRFGERVREGLLGSTASSEKRDDLFVLAAAEIHGMVRTGTWNAPACPGTALFDAARELTLDGASCLMGKPARADHLALAHDLVADVIAAADANENAADARDRAERIAIATLLSAAHGCE